MGQGTGQPFLMLTCSAYGLRVKLTLMLGADPGFKRNTLVNSGRGGVGKSSSLPLTALVNWPDQ